jgi:hypothetical protein
MKIILSALFNYFNDHKKFSSNNYESQGLPAKIHGGPFEINYMIVGD